ncbi:cation:proton antiporter [Candidatus Bathyarchaeota archaeon]|nr:cation:proton antiporter [Candidatus Bathyarchaeota archaeon]
MSDVSLALFLTAAIIVAGSLGSFLFRKTGIPDMIFLVMLGILLGPVSGVILLKDIEPLAPYLAMLTLTIILLDGGMSLNLRQTIRQSPRAIMIAVLGFVLSAITVAFFTRLMLGLSWLEGLLLGSIVGGSSSIVVVSLATRMGVSEECSTTLVLESAITDVLCTVAALTLIGVILSGLPTMEALTQVLAQKFSIGAMLGLVLGLVWVGALSRMRNEPYRYMLTLAALFLAYLTSESLGGSGALSVLAFGIVLGNEEAFSGLSSRSETPICIDESFRRLESEIAFVTKAFFFVYLGLIVSFPSIFFVAYGLMLSLLLLATHYVAVSVSTLGSPLRREKGLMSVVYARGLAAAVLALLPQKFGLGNYQIYVPTVLMVILTTTLITTIGVFHFSRKTMDTKT